MNKILSITIAVLSCFLFLPKIQADEKINIYFFYSNSCSHCHEEEQFLTKLEQDNKNLKINRYEVHSSNNKMILDAVSNLYDLKGNAVPVTIIADTAYIGYKQEKSNVLFLKTIKYYEKYGYYDRVGYLLKKDVLSDKQLDYENINNDNIPSLEEFLTTYGNYQIIGSIFTDNFDTSTIALFLGALSAINIFAILSIIIVINTLIKMANIKDKFIIIMIYLFNYIILTLAYLINNNVFKLISSIVLLLLFFIFLWKFYKKRNQIDIFNAFLFILIVISKTMENKFIYKYKSIFYNVLYLHQLSGLDKLLYYFNYFFMVIIINILLIFSIYILITNLKKVLLKQID